jgi:hypothetical protein
MANELSNGPVVYVGSHLKAEAYAGMGGDPEASSLLPGQKPHRGSVAKKIMGANVDGVTVPTNGQTRDYSSEQKVPTHKSMRSRQNSSGETVPTSLYGRAARHPKK